MSAIKSIWSTLTGRTAPAPEPSMLAVDARAVPTSVENVESTARALAVERAQMAELQGQLAVFGNAMAIVEYAPDGRVIAANRNFCVLSGFSEAELLRKSYADLVTPAIRGRWQQLQSGESLSGQYERSGAGREVWTQSFFGPVCGADGSIVKIVELATDITQQVLQSRELQASMDEVQRAAKISVDGDLTHRIPTTGKSTENDRLCSDVNAVLNARMVLIRRVKLLTVDVCSAAEEISKGNTTLSQLTESQAASVEETASSMEEMTASVKTTADNAAQASDFAMAARRQAEAGGEAVTAAVHAMEQINISSKKIADIIGVIDEIAFQTNLLALNAAVEAARAGDGGRGFAVVASEVRNLAGRSATAAKEIKSLIQDSVAKVNEGAKLVDASGKTLGDIVAAVKKVTDVVSSIAASSMEQSAGIDQVNKAVMQIDEATQQNAALVEQTAAASQAIVDQVRELQTVVAHYKVDAQSAAEAPASRRVA